MSFTLVMAVLAVIGLIGLALVLWVNLHGLTPAAS